MFHDLGSYSKQAVASAPLFAARMQSNALLLTLRPTQSFNMRSWSASFACSTSRFTSPTLASVAVTSSSLVMRSTISSHSCTVAGRPQPVSQAEHGTTVRSHRRRNIRIFTATQDLPLRTPRGKAEGVLRRNLDVCAGPASLPFKMSRVRQPSAPTSSPEAMLRKAMEAKTAATRAKYAQLGLAQARIDTTTRAMLLRQLFLAHMEGRRFDAALDVAREGASLDVLQDVARQDVARAHLALGNLPAAVQELRIAGRVSPPSRRSFHLWTLGSVLYLSGRPREAAPVFARASLWSTRAKPLYRAQQALALAADGQDPGSLEGFRASLAQAACGRGYGEFVLGELSHRLGDDASALRYLLAFVERNTSGRVALSVSLEPEIAHARAIIDAIRADRPQHGRSRDR